MIKETLQELGDTLTHFLYRATGAESSEAQLVVSFHSKVCLSFVACLVLELTVPPCDSMSMMPLSLRECLAPLAMNEVVAVAFPGVRSRLLPYLAFIQPEQFSVSIVCLVVSLCCQQAACCRCLKIALQFQSLSLWFARLQNKRLTRLAMLASFVGVLCSSR